MLPSQAIQHELRLAKREGRPFDLDRARAGTLQKFEFERFPTYEPGSTTRRDKVLGKKVMSTYESIDLAAQECGEAHIVGLSHVHLANNSPIRELHKPKRKRTAKAAMVFKNGKTKLSEWVFVPPTGKRVDSFSVNDDFDIGLKQV